MEGAKESCTEAADDSQSFAATLRRLQAEEELKEQAEGSQMAPPSRPSPPELAPSRAVQAGGRAVDHDWVQLRDANGDAYYHDYVGGATTWRASPLVMAAVGIDQSAHSVCAWLSGCGVAVGAEAPIGWRPPRSTDGMYYSVYSQQQRERHQHKQQPVPEPEPEPQPWGAPTPQVCAVGACCAAARSSAVRWATQPRG
eukprot:COSAG01_NODE_66_length_29241_cov_17.772768_30_plen_198_part_00